MSRCSDHRRARVLAMATAAAMLLSACSDIYYDRRETIAFGAADAVATDRILQTIDPWPPYAANRKLAYDGAVIGAGVQRYRAGRVIQPRASSTSGQYVQQQQQPDPQQQQLPAATLPLPGAATK